MSGHSKWAQIKHKKSVTDQKRGALFSKMGREITVAVHFGGSDPTTNQRLRAAIERARSFGLPKDNIERAIERALSKANAENLAEFTYEALGPEGALILIEGITDNKNRSFAEIKKILSNHGAKLADPGSVMWNFEKHGEFSLEKDATDARSDDDIELAIIDSGASDVSCESGVWIIECTPHSIERVRDALTYAGFHPKEAETGYKAKSEISLSPDALAALEQLLGALEEHDDIQNIYTNARSNI